MLNIYDILASTPIKDTVTIRFNRPDLPGHIDEVEATEEQVRWLQYNIAKGNYPCGNAVLISKTGKKSYFSSDGRLTNALDGNNTMSYNDNLAMDLLMIKSGLK